MLNIPKVEYKLQEFLNKKVQHFLKINIVFLFCKFLLIRKSDILLRVVNQNKIVFHKLAQEILAFIACEERKRGKRNQMDVL